MSHIDASTKDLSVALIVLVCVLLLIGSLFLITLRHYVGKGRGYRVNTTVDKGLQRNVARLGNGESSNTYMNEAYSMEKVNH
jgi:hypothetical protein